MDWIKALLHFFYLGISNLYAALILLGAGIISYLPPDHVNNWTLIISALIVLGITVFDRVYLNRKRDKPRSWFS